MYWDYVTCDRVDWEHYFREKELREYIEISPKLFESMMGVMGYDVRRSGVELYYKKFDPLRSSWALERDKSIYIYGRNRREHNRMLRFFQQQKRLQAKANNARRALKNNITLAELENFKKNTCIPSRRASERSESFCATNISKLQIECRKETKVMPEYVIADTPVGTRVRVVSDYESCQAGRVSDGALLRHLGDEWTYDYAVEFDVPEDFMHDGGGMTDDPRLYFFRYDHYSCVTLEEPIPESDFLSLLC